MIQTGSLTKIKEHLPQKMDPTHALIIRNVLKEELTEWMNYFYKQDDDGFAYILQEILISTLTYQFTEIGDIDNYIRMLREL